MRFSGIILSSLGSIGGDHSDDVFWTSLDRWVAIAVQRQMSQGETGYRALQDKQHIIATLHAILVKGCTDATEKLRTTF